MREKLFRQSEFNRIFKDITSVNVMRTRFKFDDISNQLLTNGSFPFSTWKYRTHELSGALLFNDTHNSNAEIFSNNNNQSRRTHKNEVADVSHSNYLLMEFGSVAVERLDLDSCIWCCTQYVRQNAFSPVSKRLQNALPPNTVNGYSLVMWLDNDDRDEKILSNNLSTKVISIR